MEEPKYDSPAGCLLRVFWMIIGNAILLSCIFSIAQHRSSVLSPADLFYWATVGLLLLARFAEIRRYNGTTAEGTPATMAHWRRYAMVLGLVSAGLWIAAHVVARYGT